MTVILCGGGHAGKIAGWEHWVALPGTTIAGLDPARRVPGLAQALEQAFDAVAPSWWELARDWGQRADALLAHTPSCAANASDFGLMLTWSRLVGQWAADGPAVLVICDDPWLFRHLAALPGVCVHGPVPALLPVAARLWLRGLLARARVALTVALAALKLRGLRGQHPQGSAVLLVYGHPRSDAAGNDAYFGTLMTEMPALRRLLHVDCAPGRARQLAADGRGASLHGWGHPLFAALLPLARWRPGAAGPLSWLIRRAAAREGGTGQAAMIRWQIHCQRRWLTAVRPAVVAWPWENHGWERDFVRAARTQGVETLGYQHSVIGGRMLNYAAHGNADGPASLPDHVFCTGPATLRQLAGWGVPAERLHIGGARRFPAVPPVAGDAAAPVFMALPFDQAVAAEMVAAARAAAARGWRFLVKDHPMTPFAFVASEGVEPTGRMLTEQPAVAAVVYAATTVGLEAVLMGLPTLRFRPSDRIALDILPEGVSVAATQADSLADDLAALAPPSPLSRDHIFAAVDETAWTGVLMRNRGGH